MRLNAVPFLFAPAHIARAVAPSTFAELMGHGGGPLPVWEGESTGTIWGTPQANHAFRAWHDAHHIAGALPFSLEGEREAARRQCAQLERRGLGRVAGLVWDDVAGQAAHYDAHGAFPLDQIAWHAARGNVL
jgi:hypothetical protein